MKLLKGTFILKIVSLVFAVLGYFYIQNEIANSEKKVSDPSYKLIKLTAKTLPVKLRLETSAPEGYRIVNDKVRTSPSKVTVIGPEALLEESSVAETAILDLSENTKTVVKQIPLESVSGIHITGEPYFVEVTVPIEKIEGETTG
jgi:YbbR domain-containing protein